jgi:hypothetical protein
MTATNSKSKFKSRLSALLLAAVFGLPFLAAYLAHTQEWHLSQEQLQHGHLVASDWYFDIEKNALEALPQFNAELLEDFEQEQPLEPAGHKRWKLMVDYSSACQPKCNLNLAPHEC